MIYVVYTYTTHTPKIEEGERDIFKFCFVCVCVYAVQLVHICMFLKKNLKIFIIYEYIK